MIPNKDFVSAEDFSALTIDELNALVFFLKREMKRHYQDIERIKEDIAHAHFVLRAKQTPTGYLRPYRTAMEMLKDKRGWKEYAEPENSILKEEEGDNDA